MGGRRGRKVLLPRPSASLRHALPAPQVMIHTDLGNRMNRTDGIDLILSFYRNLTAAGATDWDIIGLSW